MPDDEQQIFHDSMQRLYEASVQGAQAVRELAEALRALSESCPDADESLGTIQRAAEDAD